MTPRLAHGSAILVALLVAALVLVGVEFGKGAARSVSPPLAKPCRSRPAFPGTGLDAIIQRILLDGLDGAACRLGTTREELVLSLRPSTGVRLRHSDRDTVEAAIRAGVLRSLDEAERRGDVPGFLAPVLRRLVQIAPLDSLLRGAIGLRDLLP
jgi:hypothetical protein